MVTQTLPNRAGRKMRPGCPVFTNNHLLFFVAYCEHGGKVLAEREELDELWRRARKTKKSLRYRLLIRALKRYQA